MYEHVIERIKQSVVIDDNGCWLWQRTKDTYGYGALRIKGLPSPTQLAHRTSYEVFVGPIPQGYQIDHLCRVRACVNPQHLEPVTPRENTLRSPVATAARRARQTHCKHGHEFTEENTIRDSKGRRKCRECERRRSRMRRMQGNGRSPMSRPLRTEDEIRAAGAAAVAGWEIPDHVVDQLVTLIGPVAADVQAAQTEPVIAADAA